MEIIPNLAWLGKMQNGKDLFHKWYFFEAKPYGQIHTIIFVIDF